MGGNTGSSTHTINEDERTEFTRHINAVLAGDADIGDRLPFPTDTFQVSGILVFCRTRRGEY